MLVSLIQEQIIAILHGHQDGQSLIVGSFYPESELTSSTCASVCIDLLLLTWHESQLGRYPDTGGFSRQQFQNVRELKVITVYQNVPDF